MRIDVSAMSGVVTAGDQLRQTAQPSNKCFSDRRGQVDRWVGKLCAAAAAWDCAFLPLSVPRSSCLKLEQGS